jgi:hypothetical protein
VAVGRTATSSTDDPGREHLTMAADDDRDARARLAVVLRSAGPDLWEPATLLVAPDHDAGERRACLDDARALLLARLHHHSDDFTATAALKALDTYSAGLGSGAPARLARSGLSGIQRMRH